MWPITNLSLVRQGCPVLSSAAPTKIHISCSGLAKAIVPSDVVVRSLPVDFRTPDEVMGVPPRRRKLTVVTAGFPQCAIGIFDFTVVPRHMNVGNSGLDLGPADFAVVPRHMNVGKSHLNGGTSSVYSPSSRLHSRATPHECREFRLGCRSSRLRSRHFHSRSRVRPTSHSGQPGPLHPEPTRYGSQPLRYGLQPTGYGFQPGHSAFRPDGYRCSRFTMGSVQPDPASIQAATSMRHHILESSHRTLEPDTSRMRSA